MKKLIFPFLVFFAPIFFAQNTNQNFVLLPDGNTFQSLKTNYIEAGIGLSYYPSTGFFKVDGGMAVDLLRYYNSEFSEISFGTEFFIHGLGLNIKNKRLPIDAADGYFGVYFSYANREYNYKARLRIFHNSAHLVDGHLERNDTYLSPFDYTDDFAELTLMKNNNFKNTLIDYYAGITYSIIIHPKEINNSSFHAGLQYTYLLSESFINTPVSLFTGYHFTLTGIEKYRGNNRIVLGLEFGNEKKENINIIHFLL